MADIDTSNLSIAEAFDVGLADDKGGDGSEGGNKGGGEPPDKGGDGEPANGDDPGDGKPNGDDDEPNGDKPNGEPSGDDKDKTPTGKEPVVDPDKGIYQGEYTKERFNGLMSQWQKDRSAALKVPELLNRITELETQLKNPPSAMKPGTGQDDVELPPEIANADEETKNGFRILFRSLERKFGKVVTEDKMKTMVEDIMTKPQREQNEITTKINREREELSAEFGEDFAKNEKAVIKFAADRGYPLGTLRQAYEAWREIEGLKKGRQTVDEAEKNRRDKGAIPTGGRTRSDVIPKFDPERDGNKSYDEIWDEAKKHI